MTEPSEDESIPGKKRSRSPAYPSDSLESCIPLVRKIYDAEKRSTTSAVVAAKHLGYSSLSGAARSAIGTLKKYGLLVEEGTERIRVSDDAVRLLFAPDEAQRLAILQSLAQKPEIIRELLAEHPDGLPSDDSLLFKLVAERSFSEEAARTLIGVIRENVRFASLEPGQYTPALGMDPAPSNNQDPPRGAAAPQGAARPPAPPTPTQGSRAALHVELSDGTVVDIHTSNPLTAETFDELRDYLGVYEKVLQKRAKAAADAS